MQPLALGGAYVMDLAIGDPEWFPHPVRAMGRMVDTGEWAAGPGRHSTAYDVVCGAIVTVAVVGVTGAVAALTMRLARRVHPRLALITEVGLAWTALATGSLLAEASGVINALEREDLAGARLRLARIVGRDTATLPASEIARGLIETLAESTCDGIVAPLCYLVVGGVPAALAYKAVNTLDSMIGHREAPYTYFGRTAARLDDVANFVPARVAALSIAIAAAGTGHGTAAAIRVWRRDHAKHDSPNAGHPEAAMAGALGVTLGGTNYYDGVPVEKALLGAGQAEPSLASARAACRVVAVASILTFGIGLLIGLAGRKV
jgi:adenosylcobinamide-phosphate synthase